MLYVLLAGYAVVFLLAAGLVPPLSDYLRSSRRRRPRAPPRPLLANSVTVAGLFLGLLLADSATVGALSSAFARLRRASGLVGGGREPLRTCLATIMTST